MVETERELWSRESYGRERERARSRELWSRAMVEAPVQARHIVDGSQVLGGLGAKGGRR
jgi:hypothetical protein